MVGGNGASKTEVYAGTQTGGEGEDNELVAIGTNESFSVTFATGNRLLAGQTIDVIPRHTNRSNVVTVHRPE